MLIHVSHARILWLTEKKGPAGRASCAEGGRSHAFLTFLADPEIEGPAVGRELHPPSNARPTKDRRCKTRYTHHEVVALRAGGPSGRTRLLNPIQSLPQIRHNILNILDPHRPPHQPIRNPKPRPPLRPNRRMRHRRRMADQR